MKFLKIPASVKRYTTIFTIIFHIFIFTRIAVHYFDQKKKQKERALIEVIANPSQSEVTTTTVE